MESKIQSDSQFLLLKRTNLSRLKKFKTQSQRISLERLLMKYHRLLSILLNHLPRLLVLKMYQYFPVHLHVNQTTYNKKEWVIDLPWLAILMIYWKISLNNLKVNMKIILIMPQHWCLHILWGDQARSQPHPHFYSRISIQWVGWDKACLEMEGCHKFQTWLHRTCLTSTKII